jgi:hypothetical protein
VCAWRDAPNYAKALNSLLDALTAAAQLAGAPGDYGDSSFDRATLKRSASSGSIRPPWRPRRQAWQAWADLNDEPHQPGVLLGNTVTAKPSRRCGRWSRLTALGANIGAEPHPDKVALYRLPDERGARFVIDPTTGGYKSLRTTPKTESPRPPQPSKQEEPRTVAL